MINKIYNRNNKSDSDRSADSDMQSQKRREATMKCGPREAGHGCVVDRE